MPKKKVKSAFDRVIGYEDTIERLKVLCDRVKNPDLYRKMNVDHVPGILLCGKPGLGKTLMAECFIEECQVPTFTVRKKATEAELMKEIKAAYAEAAQKTPSIVFLDDLDKFSTDEEGKANGEAFVAVQACMDEVKKLDVLTIATTNDANMVPGSLMREGRLGPWIAINSPDVENCKKIVEYYLKQKKMDIDVNCDDVARLLDTGSCAEVETLVNMAAIKAVYARQSKISTDDFISVALERVAEGEAEISESEQDAREVAIHEAGHVLIGEVLDKGSINFACMYGIGPTVNGQVRENPKYVYGASWKHDRRKMLIALAGKAAVEMVCPGAKASGCGTDIQKAIGISRSGITDWDSVDFH